MSTRIAAVLGLTGVALGAFGAHGLKPLLTAHGTLDVWQTAVLYQLLHAVASLWASSRHPRVVWLWTAGVAVFSGSLYILAVSGVRWLGAITPVGGVLLLAGWAVLLVCKQASTAATR